MSADYYQRQRRTIKGQLTRIRTFITQAQNNIEHISHADISIRLTAADDYYEKFQTACRKLLTVTTEEEYTEKDEPDESEFDERFFAIKADLIKLAEKVAPPSA
ncbi:hypothetical protein PUN28_018432 [Cardiocondyla obscurior]|uniref:Uncharacterized protein n=1 Tax=Cardiocondyla obscurior TaxID=286306 RepID=A0AAW2EHR7_9HYME